MNVYAGKSRPHSFFSNLVRGALRELGGRYKETKLFQTASLRSMGRGYVHSQRAGWVYEQIADSVATSKLKPAEREELTKQEKPQQRMAAFTGHAKPLLTSEFENVQPQELASKLGECPGVMLCLLPASKQPRGMTHSRPGPLAICAQERSSDSPD